MESIQLLFAFRCLPNRSSSDMAFRIEDSLMTHYEQSIFVRFFRYFRSLSALPVLRTSDLERNGVPLCHIAFGEQNLVEHIVFSKKPKQSDQFDLVKPKKV